MADDQDEAGGADEISDIRRGPRGPRGVVRARVLSAARIAFASAGWRGATVRDIADAAGVDPRTVAYYFADRQELLEAVLEPPQGFLDRIGLINEVPLAERGRALVRAQSATWSSPENAELLALIMAVGSQHPLGLERLQQVYRENLIGVLAAGLPDDDALLRAGLVAGQIVGVSVSRYVWRLEPLASLDDEAVVNVVGPVLQHYLTGDLGLGARGHPDAPEPVAEP